MPAIANLVLKDRKSTPVDHTFTPKNVSADGIGTLVESSGIPVGNNTYTISHRETPSGRQKVTITGKFPIVQTETVNGISQPKVVRISRAKFDFEFEATSSEAERADVVGLMASSLDTAKWTNNLLVKLEDVY